MTYTWCASIYAWRAKKGPHRRICCGTHHQFCKQPFGRTAEQTLTERERERKEGKKEGFTEGGRRCGNQRQVPACHAIVLRKVCRHCHECHDYGSMDALPLPLRHQRSFGDDEAHISTVKAPSLFYSVVACSIGASEGSGVVQRQPIWFVCLIAFFPSHRI